SSAASRAFSIGRIPICSPSGSITRTGLIRICWFTRVLSLISVALLRRVTKKGPHRRACQQHALLFSPEGEEGCDSQKPGGIAHGEPKGEGPKPLLRRF